MRTEILLIFCLVAATAYCESEPDNNQGDHGNHDHANQDHGNHDHGNHDHGSHDHGSHDHSDHEHGSHNHGNHSHGHHDHGGHDHGHHSHGHHGHGQSEFRDCAAHLNAGQRESGVYRIQPEGCDHAIDILCDMEEDDGGWTIIQRRGDYGNDADFFYKAWDDYKNGFGELEKEFWIGNYHINHLTEQSNYELRIDMTTLADEHLHVKYGNFRVDNETRNYAIHISDFSGNTADSLTSDDGTGFSTYDRDHDPYAGSCAEQHKGAWWYKDCGHSNLNGPHINDLGGDLAKSIFWYGNDGNPILLKTVKMMVRPKA